MENTQKKAINKANDESFQAILEKVILDIPSRSREILKSRYGVIGDCPKTLEEIGREYKITRERIRQIIKEAFKKIKAKDGDDSMDKARQRVEFTIRRNSGIIKEEDILNQLGGGDAKERNAVKLLLECLGGISSKEMENEFEKSYFIDGFDFSEWKRVKDAAKSILEEEKEAVAAEEFFDKAAKKIGSIDKAKFFNFIGASQEIKKSNFGKWGLAHWSDINPKIAWQRAYVILKEIGTPLHFRKIAELIDKHNLNKRKTHPQTIHNELIKNEQFVLVGRGVYALTEWGYKKGTVKDVLEDILRDNKGPMERNAILAKISKVRQVKKSTILINLNNFFEKVEKDKYAIKG